VSVRDVVTFESLDLDSSFFVCSASSEATLAYQGRWVKVMVTGAKNVSVLEMRRSVAKCSAQFSLATCDYSSALWQKSASLCSCVCHIFSLLLTLLKFSNFFLQILKLQVTNCQYVVISS